MLLLNIISPEIKASSWGSMGVEVINISPYCDLIRVEASLNKRPKRELAILDIAQDRNEIFVLVPSDGPFLWFFFPLRAGDATTQRRGHAVRGNTGEWNVE